MSYEMEELHSKGKSCNSMNILQVKTEMSRSRPCKGVKGDINTMHRC